MSNDVIINRDFGVGRQVFNLNEKGESNVKKRLVRKKPLRFAILLIVHGSKKDNPAYICVKKP